MLSLLRDFPARDFIQQRWPSIVAGGVGILGVTYLGVKASSFFPEKRIPKYTIKFDEKYDGGRVFAESLKNHNVQFVFTLTGGHIAPILVGCKALGIQVIDVRHEVNTVFAADAVSRISGTPGVAIVTAGPGVANTITALKNAQMSQSPLVLIGGATSDLLKGLGSLQDIDQFALVKPHVKWLTHVSTVRDIVPAVEKAFQKAQEGTPGPVFIEVTLDSLYKEKVVEKEIGSNRPKGNSYVNKIVNWYIDRHINNIYYNSSEITFNKPLQITYPLASNGQIDRAAKYLSTAKQPILMVGSQTLLCNDEVVSGELVDALTKLGIPTFFSGMARGLLGQYSKIQGKQKETRRKALREADVVILCGVPMDFRLNYGMSISSKAVLISVNRDIVDLNKNKRNRSISLAINGDPCKFLLKLSEIVGEDRSKNWAEWQNTLTEKENEGEAELNKKIEITENLSVEYVVSELEKHLSKNSILVADGGDFVATASYYLRPRGPLSWLDPGPFGTLGVGAGFAMGAKLCRPESEVWIIYGDGALGFSLIEFDTFVRHKIPVIAIVGNDAAWTQIKREQHRLYAGENVGCELAFTNYHEAVKGLGAEGLLVSHPQELPDALKRAKEIAGTQKKPVLINCVIKEKSSFREGSISM